MQIFLVQWKVLDASGHVAPGFVWGNNYWLGSLKACTFVNQAAPVILSHELGKNHFKNLTYIESPFAVEYKLVWAKHQSHLQVDINTFEKVGKIIMVLLKVSAIFDCFFLFLLYFMILIV